MANDHHTLASTLTYILETLAWLFSPKNSTFYLKPCYDGSVTIQCSTDQMAVNCYTNVHALLQRISLGTWDSCRVGVQGINGHKRGSNCITEN